MSDEQPQRPAKNDDRDAWKAYWTAQGMPWRTEPEVNEERQAYLAERRTIQPDIEHGIYPFKGITLTRADVEWLLATHEDGRGPVLWIEEQDEPEDQRRWGLDLRGADITGVDLSRLPLARLRGGSEVLVQAKTRQKPQLVMRLEGVHLEGAHLGGTHLEGAHLEGASLAEARLEGANLTEAHLERSDLRRASLDAETTLDGVCLGSQRRDLYAKVSGKKGLRLLPALALAFVRSPAVQGTAILAMWMAGQTTLVIVMLNASDLTPSHFVRGVQQFLLMLSDPAFLFGALAFLALYIASSGFVVGFAGSILASQMQGYRIITLGFSPFTGVGSSRIATENQSGALLADVHWGAANLALVDWRRVRLLGDDLHAWLPRDKAGQRKGWETRLRDYQAAARAYRQLAVELRARGLNEDADAFANRAQVMQGQVSLRQFQPGRWVGSLVLDLISGYGYRPGRTLFWYVAVIAAFSVGFSLVTHGTPLFGLVTPACGALPPTPGCIHPLQWYEALVLSISSFHGRGFFQPLQNPGDPVAILAAAEAVLGLFIEITFIATFTQRFFAR